jgi:hypothetical protein
MKLSERVYQKVNSVLPFNFFSAAESSDTHMQFVVSLLLIKKRRLRDESRGKVVGGRSVKGKLFSVFQSDIKLKVNVGRTTFWYRYFQKFTAQWICMKADTGK